MHTVLPHALHAHTHTGFAYNLTEFISEASKCVSMFIS
jgi:hypothetical protein